MFSQLSLKNNLCMYLCAIADEGIYVYKYTFRTHFAVGKSLRVSVHFKKKKGNFALEEEVQLGG